MTPQARHAQTRQGKRFTLGGSHDGRDDLDQRLVEIPDRPADGGALSVAGAGGAQTRSQQAPEHPRAGSALRRGQDLQAQHSDFPNLELPAPIARASRTTRAVASRLQRHAGSRECDEAQSEPEDSIARRVFRSRNSFLSGRVRDASPADTGQPAGQHRVQVLRFGPHGLRQGCVAQTAARQRRGVHPAHQQHGELTGCPGRRIPPPVP